MAWYSSTREFTLRPNAQKLLDLPPYKINQDDLRTQNIRSNNDYRKYLTKSADSISEVNQHLSCSECCGCPTYNSQQPYSIPKYIFTGPDDVSKPFQQSDLKTSFLVKEQLDAFRKPEGYSNYK